MYEGPSVLPPFPGTALTVAACLFLALSLLFASPATSQDTGVIRVLYVGDPFMRPGFPTPALVEDPKISLTPVVGELAFVSKKEMAKAMRVYLPRTEEQLRQRHDLVVLAAIRADHLSGLFEKWVANGVIEGDLGLLMSDDPVSFGCVDAWEGAGAPGWMETPVGEVLPVDDPTRTNYEDMWYKFKPTEEYQDHPFNYGIPWEGIKVNAHNRPVERPGATVLQRTSDETPFSGYTGSTMDNSPVVVYWDYEKGRSMALVYDWGGNGVTEFYRWEYWRDVVARWFYLPAGAEIPTDVQLTHSIRQLIADFGVQKRITLSTLEFADMMGANVARIEIELGEINELRKEGDALWVAAEFEECYNAMSSAFDGLLEVSVHAIEAKDLALYWIYVSEWAVVTATLCATGFAIWTLMIRRSAYREVRTTRFGEGV
jgi:hypothetical protein